MTSGRTVLGSCRGQASRSPQGRSEARRARTPAPGLGRLEPFDQVPSPPPNILLQDTCCAPSCASGGRAGSALSAPPRSSAELLAASLWGLLPAAVSAPARRPAGGGSPGWRRVPSPAAPLFLARPWYVDSRSPAGEHAAVW